MNQEELLEIWCAELLAKLEIDGTPVDINAVLALAGKAAHTVVRPAAPLTTFVAGYAAGLAVASGQASEAVALGAAISAAKSAVEARAVAESSSNQQRPDSELDA